MSKKTTKKDISSLLTFFYELQINIKTFHWMTTSYAKHKATGKLYENLEDKIDKFIEIYIGRHGRGNVKQESIILKNMSDTEIIDYLKKSVSYLEKDFNLLIPNTNIDLINIKDEIIADINLTLYLMTLN